MSTFEEKLDKYAELAVRVGVNIQKGQSLVINTSIDSAQLVRKIVKNAYEAGADQVIVNWNDDIVSRTKYELAPIDSFKEYPKWRARETEELAENGAAFIAIVSSSPDLLKGIDPEKISTFQKHQVKH